MKKQITIRWLGNQASDGKLGSGGFWGLYLFWILLGFTAGSTTITAAMSDPNQGDSFSLSPEAKLLDELRGVVQTLREERTVFYEKQRQIQQRIQQKRDNLASLASKVAELRAAEDQVDQDLMRIEQDVKQFEIELQGRQANQAQLQKSMDDWIRHGLEAVDEGVPFRQKERRERLTPVEGEPPEPESVHPADTLGRIWSFFQEEMRLGRSGETFTKQMDIGNNRVKYAQMFRVGHQVLGYLTEDGQETGLWIERNGRKQWQHTLTDDDARGVQTAVEILDRRQEPKLIPLPISVRIDRKLEDQELEREKSTKELF